MNDRPYEDHNSPEASDLEQYLFKVSAVGAFCNRYADLCNQNDQWSSTYGAAWINGFACALPMNSEIYDDIRFVYKIGNNNGQEETN